MKAYRLTPILVAFVVVLASPAPVAAATSPPRADGSAVSQYVEQIPSAEGTKPSGDQDPVPAAPESPTQTQSGTSTPSVGPTTTEPPTASNPLRAAAGAGGSESGVGVGAIVAMILAATTLLALVLRRKLRR